MVPTVSMSLSNNWFSTPALLLWQARSLGDIAVTTIGIAVGISQLRIIDMSTLRGSSAQKRAVNSFMAVR